MDILSLLIELRRYLRKMSKNLEAEMNEIIPNNKSLVIGGAGFIGAAVTKGNI